MGSAFCAGTAGGFPAAKLRWSLDRFNITSNTPKTAKSTVRPPLTIINSDRSRFFRTLDGGTDRAFDTAGLAAATTGGRAWAEPPNPRLAVGIVFVVFAGLAVVAESKSNSEDDEAAVAAEGVPEVATVFEPKMSC